MRPPKPKPYYIATTGIGLHVNAQKTEYMCYNKQVTGRQVHLLRKQCLIDRDRHQHATNKGMDSYQ